MIYVFAPDGRVLETHPVSAKRPTNCTFGAADLKTLYVTTTEGHLFRARTERQGQLWYPAQRPQPDTNGQPPSATARA